MTDIRALFEKWVLSRKTIMLPLTLDKEGWYYSASTDNAYQAYQAATLAQQAKIEALEIQVQELKDALIVCKQYITEAIIDDKYHEARCDLDELYLLRDKAINLHKHALANTPNPDEWVRKDSIGKMSRQSIILIA